jgi:hypothetical protein
MVDPEYVPVESELKRDFGPENVKDKRLADRRQTFRLSSVPLPNGCNPATVEVLLLYAAPSAAPDILVSKAPTLPNGSQPKNVNPTTIDGEPWYNYSVRWTWSPSDTIWRNVMQKLMRFASPE